jgi:ribose-phosphate pyrophosphokinase
MPGPLLLALPGNELLAERLAVAVNGERGQLALHEFPDGESYVRVDSSPAERDVVLVATLQHPNDKILPLIFLADAVHQLGATRVGLVAPYLAYMRQDTRFHEGEAITSRSFAALLSHAVDWLLTVDPHLHRISSLRELYTIPATAIHVATELGSWIAANVRSPLIIGPDAESRQWVEGIAAAAGAPYIVLTKTRRGDADVVESVSDLGDNRSRTPVLVDDIISTGRTMIAAVQHLRTQGGPAPVCVAVHAVFANGAYAALSAAGASQIVTTNSIAHPSNRIDIDFPIAQAIRSELGMT